MQKAEVTWLDCKLSTNFEDQRNVTGQELQAKLMVSRFNIWLNWGDSTDNQSKDHGRMDKDTTVGQPVEEGEWIQLEVTKFCDMNGE